MSLKSQIKKIILENQILNKNFWNWFGNSKVIENNKPLVVYHGTNENFNVFDNSKIGYNSGNFGHYGYGFYFSIDEREAKNYGKNIIKCFLKIENPFTGTEEQVKLLKKHNIGRVDDLVETNIDFNSLALALLKVDKKLYEFIILLKEEGLEKGWKIFIEKNSDFINQNSEILNDLSDILEYTNEDSKEIPDFVFDLLKNIGIEKKI